MAFVPHTAPDREHMLQRIGVGSIEELLTDIPAHLRAGPLEVPPALSEAELLAHMRALAAQNQDTLDRPSFLGAGAYRHFIPSAVGALTGRSEFATAYTPYQPEVSQGTLQSIYEFQSLICALFELDVANASHYDGATALAEAAAMAVRLTGRRTVVALRSVDPWARAVLRTYATGAGWTLVERDDLDPAPVEALGDSLTDAACLIAQGPDFFGRIPAMPVLAAAAHAAGAQFVVSANPTSLGLLAPPGQYDADIAVADGQPLGLPPSFGGPSVGIMACRQAALRQLPGRLVGAASDAQGRRGYVLTLQAREQHIRRERAGSNICTNQALCALAVTVYLSLIGPRGLEQIATLCHEAAHALAARLAALPGYELRFASPFFHEFALRCPRPPAELNRALAAAGIVGGYELGRDYPELTDCLLLACTELTTPDDMDRLLRVLRFAF